MFSEPCVDFAKVPVLDLHRGNFAKHKDRMYKAIDTASFIALDCELSGLGDRKKLGAPSIDERYVNTCLVAKTRAIISLGISTYSFKAQQDVSHDTADNGVEESENSKSWNYHVQTFNIMVLCGEEYIVEPNSLKFLVEHGFDFEKQYSLGLEYLRGNDRETKDAQSLRELFTRIVTSKKAIVLHNGLVDLVFLYHNLWAALPDKYGTFVADLCEMFPSGIYDTKYIADYVARAQASYLEFIFRKEQKTNLEKFEKKRPHVKIGFAGDLEEDIEYRCCAIDNRSQEITDSVDGSRVCFTYAHHGYCREGNDCKFSHHIDLILRQVSIEKQKKNRKRKYNKYITEPEPPKNGADQDHNGTADAVTSKNGSTDQPEEAPTDVIVNSAGGHRAGYDAFMTGFAFATFLVHNTQLPLAPAATFTPADIKAEKLANRIYLCNKDFPMLVQPSAFSKCSLELDKKMKRLNLKPEASNGD